MRAGEAVGGPLLERLADRVGQRRMLPPVAVVHLAAVVVAAAAGVSVPQLGAPAAAR
ncbi:hypothetical protein [Dactylosporangium salmoneum]|uniref:Major facilitator superfamily (MFS) profile domain-containing protein n=1 Tax=Dactylosporangium salmoneum TaxID=53361 RepID=A0ABP5U6B3_9ACTN